MNIGSEFAQLPMSFGAKI
ncbi:TPA: small protein YadW [Citrobacter farmeri]